MISGQEYVDNIFYNLNNDYEMVTLNRSVWDVWKTPINAKYNYWGYNESVAVAGRIKGKYIHTSIDKAIIYSRIFRSMNCIEQF